MPLSPTRAGPHQVGLQACFAKVLPEHLVSLGLSPAPIWEALGLDPQGRIESSRVSAKRLSDALELAATLTGDPVVALHAAQAVRPAHLGPLGYTLLSCERGETGLELFERFQALLNNEILTHHQMRGEVVEVRHAPLEPGAPSQAPFWWFILAARLSFARWVSGRDLQLLRIDLPCPRPPHAEAFSRFTGAEVVYGQPACREVLPRAWLSWLNPNADPALHDLMQAQAAQRLAEAQDGPQWVGQCRRAVLALWAEGVQPTVEAVAEALQRDSVSGLAPGRLQAIDAAALLRLCRRDGITFKALVEDARRDEALRRLRETDEALKAVAARLGYSEPSAFHRAVKRWTGKTPAQVRAKGSGT